VSFLYPRLIQISRPDRDETFGGQPYSGLQIDNESVIASGIAAKIQVDRQGNRPEAGLPSDAAGESTWKIIFVASRGLVKTGDVITDDEGERYQVISAYWGPLVTTCRSQILQA
jgi:hypothetical protein